jgi:alpha-N-acetylglucosaminidase
VTLWGPNGEIDDYAAKNWAGLVGAYYSPRWQLFMDAVSTSIESGKPIDYDSYDSDEINIGKVMYNMSRNDYNKSCIVLVLSVVYILHIFYFN